MLGYPRIKSEVSKDKSPSILGCPDRLIAMTETSIDIRGGHSQVNPAATQAIQNNYYGQPVPVQQATAAHTVAVLGAEDYRVAGMNLVEDYCRTCV